ncbi:MAG: DUF2225 domain-containing protein [Minicystis sp.]
MKYIIALLTLLMLTETAYATTWSEVQKTDPLTGEKVPAYAVRSYGSYIYDWPSKYDLVFWPLTDERWICLDPKNGYAAFNNDFETLSAEEKTTLRRWLAKNYNPEAAPKSHKERLAWLEKVYHQRKTDDEFWSRFYRLMAYVHRDTPERSLEYVRKALPLLEAKLKTGVKDMQRLNVLFLLGEYNRRLGNTDKAKAFFAEVKTATYRDEDGTEKTGHPYFLQLVKDCEDLPPEVLPGRGAEDDCE